MKQRKPCNVLSTYTCYNGFFNETGGSPRGMGSLNTDSARQMEGERLKSHLFPRRSL